jgi:hypothetical protein
MPASQTIDYGDRGLLKISIEPIDEPESVYYTEDKPEFDLVIRNQTNREIQTREGDKWAGLRWVVEIEPGVEKTLASGGIDLSIPPGGKQRERITPGLLAYETSAVLGVGGFGLSGVDEGSDEPLVFDAGSSQEVVSQVLYTFTIRDRSHYDAVHEQPKRLQWMVVGFGFLTAVLAATQLYILVTG